jgi:prevent-host-death family protein
MDDASASIRELRDTLADVVDRATHDEPTIITRRGRQVAAVVPIALLREWRAWEEERVVRLVAERANEPTYPLEQVMAEVLGE